MILLTLREKCPDKKLFLVRIFSHSDWIRRDTDTKYLSVFSPIAGKYGLEITPYLDTFHAVLSILESLLLMIHSLHITFTSFELLIIAKNIVISPNFLAWKFCGEAQVPHSFGRFSRNYADTVPFHKISISGN